MGVDARDLEARIEALRLELAGLVVTLSKAGQQLEDLTDEVRSRRPADKVVAFDQRQRGKRGQEPDVLVYFLE
jgi:hypothetical protein